MISRLMENGLEFVVTDFPHANRFTIHILAAVAEYALRRSSSQVRMAARPLLSVYFSRRGCVLS